MPEPPELMPDREIGSAASASPKDASAKKPRVSRRVKWTQPGSTENPDGWHDEKSGQDSTANDEQLKRDKPPHWG
jgi:hypothetical protein